MDTALIWLRRDLRLADNPALQAALKARLIPLPVYIHDESHRDWPLGAASAWWLHHSLSALKHSLRQIGSDLLILQGDSLTQLLRLLDGVKAKQVFWNRCYDPQLLTRDNQIMQQLRLQGVNCTTFNAALLFEPTALLKKDNTPYKVFTPFWNNLQHRYSVTNASPAPKRLPPPPSKANQYDIDIKTLGLLPAIPWDENFYRYWTPGESGAQKALRRFLKNTLIDYPHDRDRPDVAGTSRLSPHLHFGEISPHQLWASIQHHAAAVRTPGIHRAAEAYQRQLAWREFAHHLLYHFPHTDMQPMDPRFKTFPWRRQYQKNLQQWQRGITGIPIVDAGMRELWNSGWMHNRARMIVASLLTKNLLIPWQEGARWFWDTLVDADLANNTLGWQWTAGCGADAAPFFRIFNPVRQGERFDPQGDYVRRWVPELSGLPAKWIHQPWAAPAKVINEAGIRLGKNYPIAIVDLSHSRAQALAAWNRIKQHKATSV